MAERLPAAAHQFDSLEQQREASTLGMWVFLVTEMLFFGGLFTAYAVYRYGYPEAFAAASRHLNMRLGGINTAVLLVSSLTMALAVNAAGRGRRGETVRFLLLTMALGSTFLTIKGFEYAHKVEQHLVPGRDFRFPDGSAANAEMFFVLYFVMTGLHGLHVLIGIAVMAVLAILALRKRFPPEYFQPVEVAGLYWHFVDIVWLFLYPLLYLIDRSG